MLATMSAMTDQTNGVIAQSNNNEKQKQEDWFELDLHESGSKFTNSGIYKSITDRNLIQLQRCIQYGENASLVDEEFGTSYMMLVVDCADQISETSYIPMIHELALAGCDPTHQDHKGHCALGTSIKKNLEDLMVALLLVGAEGSTKMVELIRKYSGPFEMQTMKWYSKHTPSMWTAVQKEDIRMINRLVSFWFRINITKDGVTLLEQALKLYGRQHIICDLLETNYHTNECVHAVLAGDKARIEYLKNNHNCDMKTLNKGFQRNALQPVQPRSLREAAYALGHSHILELLPRVNTHKSPQNDIVHSRTCLIS